MKLIGLNQRSEAWILYRNNGIGSSDISAIMGVNPYKKPIDVYQDKHGFSKKQFNNKAMQRGVQYENEALTNVSLLLGVELLPICVEVLDEPWMRASIDGYNEKNNLVVEIKIPKPQNFQKQCDFLEDIHFCQLQWQLAITKGNGKIFIYSPESQSGFLWDVPADIDYQENMKKIGKHFWYENVLMGIPPDKKLFSIDCIP